MGKMNKKKMIKAIGKGIAIVIVIVIIAIAGIAAYFTLYHPTTTSKVTINYYDDLAPSEAKVFDSVIIPEFEKEYPNITVCLHVECASDMVKTIESLVSAHDVGATIIAEDNMVIGELLCIGDLMNLTPYLSQIEPKSMIPSMVYLMNYEQKVYHGIYFIPFRGNIPLVWYNKTVFEEYHLPIPQNWSQLMYDSKVIYQKTGIQPIMFQGHGGASTATELYQWMVQAGGNPLVFNDSGDILAFEYLDNLSQYFNPNYIHGYWGSYKGLGSDKYYILDYQWPYIYSVMKSEGYNVSDIGFYPGPKGPANCCHLVGGDVLAIPKGATHIQDLLLFAKFLLGVQVQRDIITILGEPAVNAKAYCNLPSNVSALFKAEEDAFQHAFFREPVPWISEWNTIADNVFVKIVEDHAPISEIPSILSQANAEMYHYLETNYNSTVAQEYEEGYFHPLYG
ncbi:ABC transporter substrate-binding protein [Acidianus ambivalens]|uniref:Extracellular solute-binding protein n=1 Tax=Acidianus ambivalens TaxID=2283 RepID=A0A650CTV8_ACIAM|nr:ABC transporter substrate-binding protein [Acidianus ambivalens]MQL56224.1 extracellular solute-binding protein [Acidianus ambivalens]QGR21238.1 extracellular solute-binding protein [Acidianus ambivalens]